MANQKRRQIKLTTLFIRYILSFVGVVVLVLALTLSVYIAVDAADIYMLEPFSDAVKRRMIQNIQSASVINSQTISSRARFIMYNPDGDFIYGNVAPEEAVDWWTWYVDPGTATNPDVLVIMRDNDICVVNLVGTGMRVFRSESLRRLFPNPAIAICLLFLLMLAGATAFLSVRMSRRLRRHMHMLTGVTEHVAAQNLDYVTPASTLFEVNQVLVSMEKMRAALQDSLQTQWTAEQERHQQLAALAHDIQTPLTTVRGNTELLQLSMLSEQQARYACYILQGAERIEMCVAQLREVVTAGGLALQPEIVEASVVWDELTATLRAMAEVRRITVKSSGSCPGVFIRVDREILARAFWNVFTNAVRQSPEGGVIIFVIKVRDGRICFNVEDTGAGFSSALLAKSSGSFNWKEAISAGHGMGMYIARSIVEQHSGEWTIRNEDVTGGGQVWICLPIVSTGDVNAVTQQHEEGRS